MIRERHTLRLDDSVSDESSIMKFRLFYQGKLLAAKGDQHGEQADRRAGHKHDIRQQFHKQLAHLWAVHPALHQLKSTGEIIGLPPAELRPLVEVLGDAYTAFGFRFVPLVCEKFSLLCGLNILMLRRDKPGGVFDARDIDNRLKILFDALKKPKNLGEIGGRTPEPGETPFFVLLEEDSLISSVTVETDELLDPPSDCDDSFVRLVVEVTLSPYAPNMFNLSFA